MNTPASFRGSKWTIPIAMTTSGMKRGYITAVETIGHGVVDFLAESDVVICINAESEANCTLGVVLIEESLHQAHLTFHLEYL